jgi:hypothetical protein
MQRMLGLKTSNIDITIIIFLFFFPFFPFFFFFFWKIYASASKRLVTRGGFLVAPKDRCSFFWAMNYRTRSNAYIHRYIIATVEGTYLRIVLLASPCVISTRFGNIVC